eukprot:607155-Hanusia_phi.AAC.2
MKTTPGTHATTETKAAAVPDDPARAEISYTIPPAMAVTRTFTFSSSGSSTAGGCGSLTWP